MPIIVRSKGNFKRTRSLLSKSTDHKIMGLLEKYGQRGAEALAAATPIRTGLTASSWGYEIAYKNGSARINWVNENVQKGQNIAILIQMGHGTGTGGWVEGVNYINPSLQPIFDEMAQKLWKEVTDV